MVYSDIIYFDNNGRDQEKESHAEGNPTSEHRLVDTVLQPVVATIRPQEYYSTH